MACGAPPQEAGQDDTTDPVVISMLDDGTVLLDDEEMTTTELEEALKGMDAPPIVRLKTEWDVTYRMIDEIQGILISAGISRVVFDGPTEAPAQSRRSTRETLTRQASS